MDFEEIKKKAVDIKNDLEPKVKEKAKKAGKAVSDFVDEHIRTNNDDSIKPEETEVGEAEYVDADEMVEEEKNDSVVENVFNSFKKKKNRKKAKSVKYKNVEEEAAESDTDADDTGVSENEADAASGETTESENKTEDTAVSGEEDNGTEAEKETGESIERIDGEVVGSVKDKYNQFVQNVMPKVKDTASAVGSKVKGAATVVGGKVKEVAEDITPKVKDTLKEVGPKAKEVVGNIGPKAKGAVESIGPKVKEAAKNIGPSMRDGVKKVGPKVYEGAKKTGETISFQGYRLRKTLGKKMKGAIKSKLGIKPSGDEDGIKYYEVKNKSKSKLVCHTRTVIAHRHMVFKHCVKAGIPIQGIFHDLSKFSPSEFIYGVKFYRGDRSPNEGEREDHGFSYAWMHHKGRNKHHFEYWNDYNIQANKALPVKMPLKYVIEMFCDRVAASKIYLKDKYTDQSPYEYFDKGRSRRTIHQETSDFLEKLLKMLANKGENYTFMYIKWYRKHHKDY